MFGRNWKIIDGTTEGTNYGTAFVTGADTDELHILKNTTHAKHEAFCGEVFRKRFDDGFEKIEDADGDPDGDVCSECQDAMEQFIADMETDDDDDDEDEVTGVTK